MKLSIVTINYNNCAGLQKTIDSIISQTWRDFEWIVIDGGSTDGSRKLIEKYQDHFAFWCSEPDKGIYNAMNKGIAKAKGEYLNFMNSGDCFFDKNVIEEFVKLNWSEDVILGDAILVDDIGIENQKIHPEENELDFDFIHNGGICHQSSFIKRDLFNTYGMYDESYKIIADWKFFIEVLILHGCGYRHWDKIITRYDAEGISSKPEFNKQHIAERIQLYKNYNRIIRSIKKRDKRIQDLDLPVMIILKRKMLAKIRKCISIVKRKEIY